jgi:hypothetical protein
LRVRRVVGRAVAGQQDRARVIILGLLQEASISGDKAPELLGLNRQGSIARLARKGIPYIRL